MQDIMHVSGDWDIDWGIFWNRTNKVKQQSGRLSQARCMTNKNQATTVLLTKVWKRTASTSWELMDSKQIRPLLLNRIQGQHTQLMKLVVTALCDHVNVP